MMMSIGEIMYRLLEQPLLRAVRQSDIVTHVKTVLELVGVPGVKEEKLINLDIVDYRAPLPSDFLERKAVRAIYDSIRVAMTHMTDEFGKFNKEILGDKEEDILFTHKIVGQYIYTDFKEGQVELIYTAYVTDENGLPMIPRNESLYLAIENYIKSRHYGILADQNAQFERAYQRAEQQYCWYVGQATASLLNLDPVEAQAFGEAIIRMVPIKDNFYTNYKYAGQPERRNNSIW
jgi:hypothetical protein